MITVNSEVITDEDIQNEMERLRPEYERYFSEMDPVLREAQLMEWAKENVIERILIHQEAERQVESIPAKKVKKTIKDLKQRFGEDGFRNQLNIQSTDEQDIFREVERNLRVQQLLDNISDRVDPPTQKEIENYYQKNEERFTSPEQVKASHIVKHPRNAGDRETARQSLEEARERIQNGESFEEVAKEYTDCPPNEINLGYFARGQMVERFEQVVFSLPPGSISEVFETEFGYHIAKVHDYSEPALVPLQQVKEQIVSEVNEQKKQEAIENFTDALKTSANIEEE